MQFEALEKYSFKTAEAKWQQYWHDQDIYQWQPNTRRDDSFVIDTPPPTVSGVLHMGHIFSYTQTDFIARFRRMYGLNVFYPIGFDDNGLPTERLVEKTKKVKAHHLPRAEFTELCREVVTAAEEQYRQLFKSIALSVDWQQEYQTISPQSQTLSQASFLDLYHQGHLYRNQQPTLWDPVDSTALAQADVEDREFDGLMVDIPFTDDNYKQYVVATTRPELLPACVAVLYHPDDTRYQHLATTNLYSPLFKVKVPCLTSDQVQIDKGSGLVMCCTFGDITDVNWWRQFKLPLRIIITKYGKIDTEKLLQSSDWPCQNKTETSVILEQLNGLKVKAARLKMIELLEQQQLILVKREITHSVKCAERSGAPLEIIVTPQWNIAVLPHQQQLLKQAKQCKFYPSHMQTRLIQWIEGLSWDWCISRQRYFGVPFPVWYSKREGEVGKILIADYKQLPLDPQTALPSGYSRNEVEPDLNVMDTWATSSISPQLNSHGISANFALDKKRHQQLFPADLRPQAHEIIRTWTFYTIVKAYLHQQTIPWQEVMISGWCLAEDKNKMSKSKGNVVDPVKLVAQHGADVIRYWAVGSRLGADIIYSDDLFKIGKKLQNKLWNAAKFVSQYFTHLPEKVPAIEQLIKNGSIYCTFDLWLISHLQHTWQHATEHFLQHEYCQAKEVIEHFFWKIFCDNYLEIVKVRAYDESGNNPKCQLSAIYTLYHALELLLKLWAPITPHICEEIYQKLYANPEAASITARGSWPKLSPKLFNQHALKSGDTALNVIDAIRRLKSEHNLSPKASVAKVICSDFNGLNELESDLKNVMSIQELSTDINNTLSKADIIAKDLKVKVQL
ncbi:MAG: valine--tRNA ligase [Pseudomonadota bacterium]